MTDAAPRRVDPTAAAYLRTVDSLMATQYGVSYFDVHQDLHGGLDAMKAACTAGTAPGDFVRTVASPAGFRPISSDFSAADANAFNRWQAALICYARENPHWHVGTDGIYSDSKGGVVRFHPHYDETQRRWQFGLSVGEGSLAGIDVPSRDSFSLELAASELDIGDSLELLAQTRPEFADFGEAPESGLSAGPTP